MSRKPPKMDMIGTEVCDCLWMYYYFPLYSPENLCIIYKI